jgi:uncharacterized membrane protein YagU involved in acid resistance
MKKVRCVGMGFAWCYPLSSQPKQWENNMQEMLKGATAGFLATVPMTAAMEMMHRELPEQERYPLPPREITDRLAEEAGVKKHLDEPDRFWLALTFHFGFGSAMGALYAPMAGTTSLPAALEGAGYGLAVWTGNYLGLLPATGILTSATKHPPRRTGLMIAAHLVWGAALGVMVDLLKDKNK